MSFLKETWARLAADTPSYFKKIRAFGLSLTAGGTSMVGVPAAVHAISATVKIPEAVTTYGGHMLLAGVLISIVAGLPCQNPGDVKK